MLIVEKIRIIKLIIIIIIIRCFNYTYQWSSTANGSWWGGTCLTLRQATWWDKVGTLKPSNIQLILDNSHSMTWKEKVPKIVQQVFPWRAHLQEGVHRYDKECAPPVKGYIVLPTHNILRNNCTNVRNHNGSLIGPREVGQRSSTHRSYHISKGMVNCRDNTLGYVNLKVTGVYLRSWGD